MGACQACECAMHDEAQEAIEDWIAHNKKMEMGPDPALALQALLSNPHSGVESPVSLVG